MADYYTILARAVGALEPNTAAARRRLYDRARSAMVSEIEKAVPPFDGADVAAAKIAFESTVVRVEAEAVHQNSAAAANNAPPLSPGMDIPRGERSVVSGSVRRGTWLTDLLE
jgi:hypothetical protein